MFKKSSRLISLIMVVAMALTVCCCAFAAEGDVSFTIRSVDGYSNPIGGAAFGLYGPDGSIVANTATGADGTATMTIPAAVIGETGDTNLTLVQTAAPAGHEMTDNNWAVTVSGGSAYVDTMGLWDTMYDWIDGTVLTGADFSGNILTVANTATYYELPISYKTVSGLDSDQIKNCTSTFELTNAAGTVVATGHAIGYAEQANGSYTAQIAFDTEQLPAGSYKLTEKNVADISGMELKSTSAINGNTVTIGSRSVGDTITVAYAAPYVAPVVTTKPADENPAETTDPEPSTTPVTDETGDPLTEGDTTIEDGKVPTTDGTNIEDEDTPTSDAPQQANATVWVIIVAAFVILAAAIYSITGKKKAGNNN